ncbi:hypothetical protein H1R20_g1839, partial [Candolleomyces eurysporus]
MGQFIILPDGKLLVVNGALNGTAGYAQRTFLVESYADMPYGESLANGPVGRPAIYDPKAAPGKRWSNAGLDTSPIARMYHSSAQLLPDASVLIAGSNPNVDVNLTTLYPTEYRAEVFYPPYFSATTRPTPQGVPSKLTYGGNSFDVTIPPSSYSGSANDAAENTVVAVLRGGFTTHAMNMGQRYLQLNNTYTVKSDGSIVLHVSQMPPVPEIFQPGPGFIFVTVKGIPSNGTYVIVGSGAVGTQEKLPVQPLPQSVRLDSATGTADGSTTGGNNDSKDSSTSSTGGMSTGTIVAAAVGAVAAIGIIGAIVGVCLARRRRAAARAGGATSGYPMTTAGVGAVSGAGVNAGGFGAYGRDVRASDSSAFAPLHHGNASTASFVAPYKDGDQIRESTSTASYDPYANHGGPGRY